MYVCAQLYYTNSPFTTLDSAARGFVCRFDHIGAHARRRRAGMKCHHLHHVNCTFNGIVIVTRGLLAAAAAAAATRVGIVQRCTTLKWIRSWLIRMFFAPHSRGKHKLGVENRTTVKTGSTHLDSIDAARCGIKTYSIYSCGHPSCSVVVGTGTRFSALIRAQIAVPITPTYSNAY